MRARSNGNCKSFCLGSQKSKTPAKGFETSSDYAEAAITAYLNLLTLYLGNTGDTGVNTAGWLVAC